MPCLGVFDRVANNSHILIEKDPVVQADCTRRREADVIKSSCLQIAFPLTCAPAFTPITFRFLRGSKSQHPRSLRGPVSSSFEREDCGPPIRPPAGLWDCCYSFRSLLPILHLLLIS